jgi:hypothetical protein
LVPRFGFQTSERNLKFQFVATKPNYEIGSTQPLKFGLGQKQATWAVDFDSSYIKESDLIDESNLLGEEDKQKTKCNYIFSKILMLMILITS